MKMPNKVTPYKESSIAKFPVILELLEKKNMTPSELFSKVRKNNKIKMKLKATKVLTNALNEELKNQKQSVFIKMVVGTLKHQVSP